MKISNLLLAVFFLVPLLGLSVESLAADDEASIQEKALKRQYPGGRDEEDLKVFSQVPEPTKKVYKQTVQNEVMKSMSGQSSEAESSN